MTTIRINDELKTKAEMSARLAKRSMGKQIEYWAEIGEAVSGFLSVEEVYALLMGNLGITPKALDASNSPSMDDILGKVEERRVSGSMTEAIARSEFLVEADPDNVGGIRIVHNGEVVQGVWREGRFVANG